LLQSLYDQFKPMCVIKNITLNLRVPDPSNFLVLNTDMSIYTKILSHLLDNAVKFTSEGAISFGYSRQGSNFRFFVSDTGVGIQKEIQPVIFEQFMQEDDSNIRAFDGSGLGLSIVRGLVRLLGGEIEFESEKGHGTTFFFHIPSEEIPFIKDQVPVKPDKVIQTGKPVILIAEDDETNYLYIKTILQRKGYSIIWASNGKDAVGLCESHPEISLVIMDIKMPEMDGLTATRLIKIRRPDLTIIAVTAFAMSGDEQMATEAGCDDYIAKPIMEDRLISKISSYFKF